jgi:cyclomaltodextrinase
MPDIQTPEWVKDAVFYQIFPDRFARSDAVAKPAGLQPWGAPPTAYGYQGGDLWGVVEHLDYLTGLGVNAIYFNPIFRSASNHRYHTHDYYQVDPMLGGNDAFNKLLSVAHARGIRIVLDGVFNHASRGFFQFHDILENGTGSAYLDWFTVEDWPLRPYANRQPNYRCWDDNPALPKLNTATPAVRSFIYEVARHWIELGVDGWRLDVPAEIDDDAFWRDFRAVVKGANPQAYIVGEIWDEAGRWLQGDQFDAVMNYPLARAALGFFAFETFDRSYRPGGFRPRPLGSRAFGNEIDRLIDQYPWPVTQVQLNLLDSHDTARFINQACDDQSALRLALLFLMTMPGAPCIYYGTEIGMTGGPDPDCRKAFPWEGPWDRDLLDYTKRAIALRHAHPALRRGSYECLYAFGNLYAFGRRWGEDGLVVVFNVGHETEVVSLDVEPFLPNDTLRDVWNGVPGRITKGRMRRLAMPPRSAAVFGASGTPA